VPSKSAKPLPPLLTDTAYRAQEFQSFEYEGRLLNGNEPILRLHLANSTTIDLPTTDEELQRLCAVLIHAYGQHAIDVIKDAGWWKP
jgi:hypothetical protein